MSCLKCGKKTADEQVFCADCLSSMEAYPVKPDVHVQLPNRPAAQTGKKSGRKRRALTKEEQIAVLRRRVRRLIALVLLLAVLLGVLGAMLADVMLHHEELELGKNYTFVKPFD